MHKPPLASADYIPAGKDTPAKPPPEGARLPSGSTTIGPWQVVSKCALRRAYKEEGAPRSFPDTPASVPFCWSITAFSACVILPQMNRQPMCIWMVKPPFTQYISTHQLKKHPFLSDVDRFLYCCLVHWIHVKTWLLLLDQPH